MVVWADVDDRQSPNAMLAYEAARNLLAGLADGTVRLPPLEPEVRVH